MIRHQLRGVLMSKEASRWKGYCFLGPDKCIDMLEFCGKGKNSTVGWKRDDARDGEKYAGR
jgi:hypothetical protein